MNDRCRPKIRAPWPSRIDFAGDPLETGDDRFVLAGLEDLTALNELPASPRRDGRELAALGCRCAGRRVRRLRNSEESLASVKRFEG
jgi:hypothetical protein